MARLKGIIKLQGTLDDLTFYKTQDGHLVKTKSSISKDRIANDPAFIRTRENGSEFGSAASAGKLLRVAVKNLLATSNNKLTSRVTKLMMLLRTADITSMRGDRNVYTAIGTTGGQNLIKGFDFNPKAPLGTVLLRSYTLDKTTGSVAFLDMNPMTDFVSPKGTTSISITAAWAKLDFKKKIFDIFYSDTFVMNLETQANGPFDLSIDTKPKTPGISLFLLSVEFKQEVNGVLYSLNNGAYNACAILDAAVAV